MPASPLSLESKKTETKARISKPSKARPYVCGECTRAFARLEHLKRHQRSHTNEKPFQCAACGRCFARRDLVLRHQQKLHASLPTNNRTNVPRRAKGKKVQPREGEIVSDYLNDNINIVKNNTSTKLPLPNKANQIAEGVYLMADGEEKGRAEEKRTKRALSRSPKRAKKADKKVQAPLMAIHEEPTEFYDGNSLHSFHDYMAYPSNPVHPAAPQPLSSDPHASQFRDHRHASFSAAASGSYTGFAENVHHHILNNLETLESEAPSQLNFSSPQFKHLPDGHFGYEQEIETLNLTDLGEFAAHHQQQAQEDDISGYLNNHNYQSLFNKAPAPGGGISSGDSSTGSSAKFQQTSIQTPVSNSPLTPFQQKPVDGIFAQLEHPAPSSSHDDDFPSPEQWLSEFVNAPLETEFPQISDHVGFGKSPSTENSSASPNSPKASSLSRYFRSRQLDLFKHMAENPTLPSRCSAKLRDYIVHTYHLKESQFPQLDELNSYLALYELEFSRYFPFVHVPSLNVESHLDQVPLLLSMAAIGALYSFHAFNSSTLFNFSRFLIHKFMESQLGLHEFSHVPLHIIQALLLHLFLGMFHNDLEVTRLTGRQLSSLISLVKATKLDQPLDAFLPPPALATELSASSQQQLKACHDYFILAQSRIRTIHTLHHLSVLYAALAGTEVELRSDTITCGSFCATESLWQAKTYNEWLNLIKESGLRIDSKFALLSLSSGINSYKDLWGDLRNLTLDKEVGLRTLLSLLLSIHGFIHTERQEIEQQCAQNKGAKNAIWRMNKRPYIESLLKAWEACFVRNGGFLVPKGQNLRVINVSSPLKLILPLLSLAKICKCVYVSPILSKVWARDWDGMNDRMQQLADDAEALRDSIPYCLDIVNLWIEIISINSDAEKISIRTPIFFLTCLFTSTLLISQYLYLTEVWANEYIDRQQNPQNEQSQRPMTTADRVLWLRVEAVFRKVESKLLPPEANNTSYAEFLRIQANGALDTDTLDQGLTLLALESDNTDNISRLIVSSRLSARCLSLGVRILADAPVWPIALAFAEALKARATAIHQHLSTFTPKSAAGTASTASSGHKT